MYSVLYVDDEEALLEIAKLFLERSGEFAFETTLSAKGALELLASRPFDAIISDYQMPGMDGIELLKKVRSMHGDIPFILFTGKGREEVVIQAINHGADFYLQKGGEPKAQFAELAHKIRQGVKRKNAQDALTKNEEDFRSLVESARDAIYISVNQQFVYVNPAAVKLFGAASADDLLGMSLYDRIHPSYHDAVGERARLIVDERKPGGLQDMVYLKMDGTPVNVESSVSPFRYRDHPAGLIILRDITIRKQAEDELRAANEQIRATEEELRHQYNALEESRSSLQKSEKDYRAILENIQDVYYRADTEGRLVMASPSGAALLGYQSLEELIGIPVRDFYADPSARDTLLALLEKDGSVADFETSLRKRDGTIVIVSTSSHLIFNDSGEFAGVEGIFRDITRRRHAEDLLKEEEELLRATLESTTAGILAIGEHQKVTHYNTRFAEMWKIPRDILRSGDDEQLLAFVLDQLADPEQFLTKVRELYTSSIYDRGILLFRDGRVFERTSLPLMRGGGVSGRVWNFRDITRRRQAEVALEQSNARYRLILQSANDAILIHEIDNNRPGRFIEVNDQACRMLGYTRDELLGMSIADIDVPEQAGNIPAIQHRLNTTGKMVFQTEHLTRDGHRIPVEVSTRLVELDGRQAALSIVRDLTDQKRTEKAVLEANRNLKLLNSITRHDIRNKLSVIEGYLCLVHQKIADPALAGFIGKMESASRSIGEDIEFTKIYQDLGTTEPRWQDLGLALPRTAIPPAVDFQTDVEGILVYADPLFEKVFPNLLDNTLRHGGHVTTIRVSAHLSPEGLVIAWEDNGAGIPREEKTKVFEQGHGRNTGLGLFLCREILSMTGIAITENGIPGKGARFEITVPKESYRFS